jgi:hypothetical protein
MPWLSLPVSSVFRTWHDLNQSGNAGNESEESILDLKERILHAFISDSDMDIYSPSSPATILHCPNPTEDQSGNAGNESEESILDPKERILHAFTIPNAKNFNIK